MSLGVIRRSATMAISDNSRPRTTSADCVHDYRPTTKRPLKTSQRPHTTNFYSRSLPSKQSGTPRQSSPTSQDLTRPATVLSRPTKDLTRPFQTIKVGRGRPRSRLSVIRVLEFGLMLNLIVRFCNLLSW